MLVLPGKAFAHIPGTYAGDYSFHSGFACTSSASSEETSWLYEFLKTINSAYLLLNRGGFMDISGLGTKAKTCFVVDISAISKQLHTFNLTKCKINKQVNKQTNKK